MRLLALALLILGRATAEGDFGGAIVSDFIARLRRERRPALVYDIGANMGTWGETVLGQAQQAAGLEMAHCSRAWMERAALEFATTSERASSSPSAERSLTSTGSERSLLRGLLPLPADGSAASEAEPLLALSRLACIVLNSCCSLEIGEMLVRALPRVALVCWSTLTEEPWTAAHTDQRGAVC